MQTLNIVFIGIGTGFGSILAAIFTGLSIPEYGFLVGGILAAITTISGYMLDEALETNEFATVKDTYL